MDHHQYTRVFIDSVEKKLKELEIVLAEEQPMEFSLYADKIQEVIAQTRILRLKFGELNLMIELIIEEGHRCRRHRSTSAATAANAVFYIA